MRSLRAAAAMLALGFASHLAGAEQIEETEAKKNRNPSFAIDTEVVIGLSASKRQTVDLGNLPTDRLVDVTLRIVNEGSERLNFDEVQVSCGCIQAKLEHPVIDRGKEGICRLTIDTTPN